jgi:hypothetical protein
MTLVDAILARIQEDLRRIHAEAKTQPESLGAPPREVIVEQKAPSSDPDLDTGASIDRWRVTVETIRGASLQETLPDDKRVGMYWEHGRGFFAILDEPHTVRMGWVVGPRYGRGFDFPILDKGGGSPILGAGICTWVS